MNARKLLRSFGYATEGIVAALKEQNLRFHVLAALVVFIASMLTKVSIMEWCIIVLVVFGMFTVEMINSAIERVVDLASPEHHELAKAAKDIAAGAVLVFSIASVIIGVLIFLPKWL
ncbi:diacylglycerol kinase family protein [Caryophanon latum]|uniref:UDP kinase n=1 Tax=Caryophanon latum TaxID=33977 RepID=A0A1C0Z549_9BACL|nr:diacylglycerol kinase family protein [Caryophanon latum]OCS94595.1 UDP kinase [Caryophanon latum]